MTLYVGYVALNSFKFIHDRFILHKNNARFCPVLLREKKKKNSKKNETSLYKDLLSAYMLDTRDTEINMAIKSLQSGRTRVVNK